MSGRQRQSLRHLRCLFILVGLLLLLCYYCASLSAAESSPLERYFFRSQPLLVVHYYKNNNVNRDALNRMFDGINTTTDLLEMRIIQEFNNPSTPQGKLRSDRIGSWQLWASVKGYLERPSLFRKQTQRPLESLFFARLGDAGGCNYCGSSFESSPVLAHFSNSQSLAKYPILPTFGSFLLEGTKEEEGTLDYFITHPLKAKPTNQRIRFLFDRLDFWELYDRPSSFDVHIKNVNETLKPRAADWFQDLGSIATRWHQVLRFTSGCWKCN